MLKKVLLKIYVLLFSFVFISSCNKDFYSVGIEIFDQQFNDLKSKTFPIFSYQQSLDKVQTNQKEPQNDITPNINQEKIIKKISRKDALTEVDRIIIENEKVKGSISLKGGIFDDLSFKNYKKK